jgi:hypothetical protein
MIIHFNSDYGYRASKIYAIADITGK